MQQSGQIHLDERGAEAAEVDHPIARLLRDARKRLIETGTRNRLIHTPRGAKRTRSIAISVTDTDAFFDTAARSNRAMRFIPKAEGKEAVESLSVHDRRIGAGWLYTNLEDEALHKKLLALHRDAKTAEDEQGINILFLAFGFLRWFEDGKSDVAREAPLILIPAQLVRDKARSGFDLRAREEDIVTNEALQERLRADFGIHLPDILDGDEWRPGAYFAAVRQAITSKPAWTLDEAGVELGFYSFAKLLMIKDLEPSAWPGASILEHEALKNLLVEGFSEEEPLFADDVRLDEVFAPADLIQVVDADASQTLVIETVRTGRNLVVQGPPGTGKSQTIANIVAAAVHDGKTVLFVAEKMVALEVVQERLQKAGIGQVCLQLHSRATNKRLLAEELGRVLLLLGEANPGASDSLERLAEARNRLNVSAMALHMPVANTGMTPFQALGGLVAAAEQPPVAQVFVDEAMRLDAKTHHEAKDAAERLAALTAAAGPATKHPWAGVGALRLQPLDIERISPRLVDLAAAAVKLAGTLDRLKADLGWHAGSSLESAARLLPLLEQASVLDDAAAMFAVMLANKDRATILKAVEAGHAFIQAQATYDETFTPDAKGVATHPIRAAILPGTTSFFARWGGAYRRASRELAATLKGPVPRAAAERLALVDRLAAFQGAQTTFAAVSRPMEMQLADRWAGESTDFDALASALAAVDAIRAFDARQDVDRVLALRGAGNLGERIEELRAAIGDLEAKLAEPMRLLAVNAAIAFEAPSEHTADPAKVAARCHAWNDARRRYDEWSRLAQAQHRLGLVAPAFASAIGCGGVPHYEVATTLRTAWSEAVWMKAVEVAPMLRDFVGADHDRVVEEFRRLDVARRASCAAEIRARHVKGMPRGSYGPMGVIRGEVGRRTRHMAIRRLIREAGSTLQRIKPVFMMSPISVAQYLAPGSVSFDLLVVDEASQIRPEDALGLVARAKQIVVVGDKKQLPPTSFFARMTADDEDDEDDDDQSVAAPKGAKSIEMESILSLCEARGLAGRMLRWHYRSRHPSLIEVSNAEFYRHLVMPPAPESERSRSGLIMRRVAGAYDRGGKRTNAVEAEAIAKETAAHARCNPDLTLGIVTFSTVQRDAVTDALESLRRTDKQLDAFLGHGEGGDEEVFVKSLENVQGDERDVILVSVGYGPRIAGTRLDSMSFGPVSAEGGERRLNVLFTRARVRCQIFASFGAGDIDLSRARGEGPRVLKRFLQYAETGVLEEHLSVGEDFDSPFEAEVAAAIEAMGYQVDKQIGSAGFRIDLAVRHPSEPGRFMLAVECDGATYHSALWARERDRLRQEVLENLGWRFYRIWSTDWFYRRGLQIERLRAVLMEAVEGAGRAPATDGPPPPVVDVPPPVPTSEPTPATPSMPAYRIASVAVPAGVEPHEVRISQAVDIVLEIIRQEGPILQDEIARRFANAFGKERTGARIVQAVDRALDRLQAKGETIHVEDRFWMTVEQRDAPAVRDRSRAPAPLQKADAFAPCELRAAIAFAKADNGPLPPDAMAVAVARLFGFQRAGPDFKSAIRREMEVGET